MAKKSNDWPMEMMTSAWDDITTVLITDLPDHISPERQAVINAIRRLKNVPAPPKITMSTAVNDYIAHRQSAGVSASSIADYRVAVNQFAEFVGQDMAVSMLSKQIIDRYLTDLNSDTSLAYSTKVNKFNYIKDFCTWLQAKSYITADPQAIFKIFRLNRANCKGGSTPKKVVIISDGDAGVITDNLKQFENSEHPWRYWLWLLCLYHGARAGEMCQLHTDDIITDVGGVPVTPAIRISDGAGQSVKNKSSRRVIPIHPYLLDCGFLGYVKKRAKGKPKALFELGTPHPKNGYTQTVNKFYSPFIKKLYKGKQIVGDYTLKNCRATFETKLLALSLADTDRLIGLRITGRTINLAGVPSSTTQVLWQHYIGNDFSPDDMLPVLSQVIY